MITTRGFLASIVLSAASIAVALCVLWLGGCTYPASRANIQTSNDHNLEDPKIEYLGVGGWLIHWKGEGVLMAPSFSNPGLLGIKGVPPLRVASDPRKITTHMPEAKQVKMLLVGHAHYDHLLDVAYVVNNFAPRATVYGSETVGYLLHPAVPPITVIVPSQAQVTRHNNPAYHGTWFYSSGEQVTDGADLGSADKSPPKGKVRAMPLESMHAPHLLGINLIPGAYDQNLDKTPGSIFAWKNGKMVLAWVIDLLDEQGKPVYRIHYQDSAADPPWGFPPVIADSKNVDVEILCGASWDEVSDYPAALLRVTRPRLVLVGHWENFFANDLSKPPRTIPLQEYAGLLTQLHGYPHVFPEPLSEVRLPQSCIACK